MYEVTLEISVPDGMQPEELATHEDNYQTKYIEEQAKNHGCLIKKEWSGSGIARVIYHWPDKETHENFKTFIATIFDQEALVARRSARIELLGGSITITRKEL